MKLLLGGHSKTAQTCGRARILPKLRYDIRKCDRKNFENPLEGKRDEKVQNLASQKALRIKLHV